MSGVATIIAGVAAGVGALGVGISAYNGAQANDAQQAGLKQQKQATQTAEANSLSTERKNATAVNQANQQTPDIASIMQQAAKAAKGGVGSTMLTGSGGTGTGATGGTTLLGS